MTKNTLLNYRQYWRLAFRNCFIASRQAIWCNPSLIRRTLHRPQPLLSRSLSKTRSLPLQAYQNSSLPHAYTLPQNPLALWHITLFALTSAFTTSTSTKKQLPAIGILEGRNNRAGSHFLLFRNCAPPQRHLALVCTLTLSVAQLAGVPDPSIGGEAHNSFCKYVYRQVYRKIKFGAWIYPYLYQTSCYRKAWWCL